MKVMRASPLAAVALLCAPTPVLASQQSGTVALVATSNAAPNAPDGIVLSGTRTAKPACATDDVWAATSAKTFSLALSASLASRSMTIVGTGACNASQPNREDIGYVTIP
jgi:hypothetical protein